MRNWRIISTIAAIVLAAIAGVLVWKYVTSADTRAEHDKGFVPALVARSHIARGTPFDQALSDNQFEKVRIPRESLPPDRIVPATDKALQTQYGGKVAATDIFTGTALVSDQFVASSNLVSTVAGSIPKGDEAITVSLDSTHAVGGFVTPGDKVNIIFNGQMKDGTKSGSDSVRVSAFLLPGIKVLAVGSTTVIPQSTSVNTTGSTTPTTAAPSNQQSGLITLQVTPREALQIVQGTAIGSVYMSLNPPDFTPGQFKDPGEIVEAINLFDQPLPLVNSTLATLNQGK